MPGLTLIRAHDLRWSLWKNGGGRTQELAVWPAGASLATPRLDWRLARAECARPGPFSFFPGYDRLLMPLSGDLALRLDPDAAPRRVRKGECARFDGESTTSVELPMGPVVDLNLLVARGLWRGTLLWSPLGRRRLLEDFDRGHLVMHIVAGDLRVRVSGEDEPHDLAACDTLWLRDARPGDVVELSGLDDATTVALARIEPLRDARD